MASADWTWWEVFTTDTLMTEDIQKYKGEIWFFSTDRKIRVLDENNLGSSWEKYQIPTVRGTDIGNRFFWKNGYYWASIRETSATMGLGPILWRINPRVSVESSSFCVKVLDPVDGTGWSMSPYDSVSGARLAINANGFYISMTEADISEHAGNRGLIIYSANGITWDEVFHDTVNNASGGSSALLYPSTYQLVQYRNVVGGYQKITYNNPNIWYDHSTTQLGGLYPSLLGATWGNTAGNPDQWLYSYNNWDTYYEFKDDTGASNSRPSIAAGYYWNNATNGLQYYDPDTGWTLDYPNSLTSNLNIFYTTRGYNGRIFFWQNLLSGGKYYPQIYRRDAFGGAISGIGRGSNKISIDRDSAHVYCTTYGIDTRTTDYWRVNSTLSEVKLIEESYVSGVYGGVHSAEIDAVHCYGNFDNVDIVRVSADSGITFSGWAQPSGIYSIEASTLYTKRYNSLPDDVLITITLASGVSDIDLIYSHPTASGWVLMTSGAFIAESQVRRDEHSLLGALFPQTSRMVDYSSDGGYTWEERDTFLPDITITDLEFA